MSCGCTVAISIASYR